VAHTRCSSFRPGSAGEFFPPDRKKTYVDYFTPDLCRTIRFQYNQETEVLGVPGYEYILGDEFFGNATYFPENACYNPYPSEDIWLPNGLLNVSSCKFDAPAYVSAPHFFGVRPCWSVCVLITCPPSG